MDADEDLVSLFDENWSVSEDNVEFMLTNTLLLLTKNYDEISTKLKKASLPSGSGSRNIQHALSINYFNSNNSDSEDSAVTRSNHKVEISPVNALRNESSSFFETIPSKSSNKTTTSRKLSEKNVSVVQEKFPVKKLVDYSDSDDSDSVSCAEHSGEKLDNFPTTTASRNHAENSNETEQPKLKRGRTRKNLNETKPNTQGRKKIKLMKEAVMSLENENIENTNEKKQPKKRGRPRKN